MAQEKSSTSSQTVIYQIMPSVSMTDKTHSLMETDETTLLSFNIVTSPQCTCKAQQPLPPNQPPQTNPLQTQYLPHVGMGNKPKTKEVPKVGTGDKLKTKEVPNVGTGDKPKTKEMPKVEMGDKPKRKEVFKVGMGDKPQISNVPKVGAGNSRWFPLNNPHKETSNLNKIGRGVVRILMVRIPMKIKEYTEMPVFLIWFGLFVKFIIQNALNDLTSKFSKQ